MSSSPSLRLVGALAVAAGLTIANAADAGAAPITKPRWLDRVLITQYFPVPERWFVGRRVSAPGLKNRHRLDWLYSARGLSMEGDGIGLDGRRYHIHTIGAGGWVNARGRPTAPTREPGRWSNGGPFWRAGGFWRNRDTLPTFRLAGGGWYDGTGVKWIRPPAGISFAPGPSRPLRFWSSVAVDPKLIPLGSRIYVPAYRHKANRGWFRAQDVGGAIIGRHIDVFRRPPSKPGGGDVLTNQKIYVVPPRAP